MAKVLELQLQQQSFQWIFYNPINGRKKKTPWVASWGNFQRGNRFEDLWRGYDFILLESSKLACHIASWVSQRTPWFTDKGQFITAMELARLSSICVLIPKLKFSKVIWRGPGGICIHSELHYRRQMLSLEKACFPTATVGILGLLFKTAGKQVLCSGEKHYFYLPRCSLY